MPVADAPDVLADPVGAAVALITGIDPMYEHIMEGRDRILASLDAAEGGGVIRRGEREL